MPLYQALTPFHSSPCTIPFPLCCIYKFINAGILINCADFRRLALRLCNQADQQGGTESETWRQANPDRTLSARLNVNRELPPPLSTFGTSARRLVGVLRGNSEILTRTPEILLVEISSTEENQKIYFNKL